MIFFRLISIFEAVITKGYLDEQDVFMWTIHGYTFIYLHTYWRVCPFLWKKRWCGDSITLKWPPGGRGMTEWMDDVISHIVKHCVYQQSINNTGWTSGPKKSREIEILNFCSSDWYLISYWYIALRIQKKGTLSHQRRELGTESADQILPMVLSVKFE